VDTAFVSPDFQREVLFGWEAWNDVSDWVTGIKADNFGASFGEGEWKEHQFGTALDWTAGVSNATGFRWTDATGVGRNAWLNRPVTAEALIYLPSTADEYVNRIFRIGGGAAGSIQISLEWDAGNGWHEIDVRRLTGGVHQSNRLATPFPTDRWVHVVGTFPPNTTDTPKVYLDGVDQGDGWLFEVGTGGAVSADSSVEISDRGFDEEFDGAISHLRVYDGLMDADEVRVLAADPFGPIRHHRDTSALARQFFDEGLARGGSAGGGLGWNFDPAMAGREWEWIK
jgi:hypothetical protein